MIRFKLIKDRIDNAAIETCVSWQVLRDIRSGIQYDVEDHVDPLKLNTHDATKVMEAYITASSALRRFYGFSAGEFKECLDLPN